MSLLGNTHGTLGHKTQSASPPYPPPPRWGGSVWSLWREAGESQTQTPGWYCRCRYPNRSRSRLTQWWTHPACLYSHSTVTDHWSGLEILDLCSCTCRSVRKCEGILRLITDSYLGQHQRICKKWLKICSSLGTHVYGLGYGFLGNNRYSDSTIFYLKILNYFAKERKLNYLHWGSRKTEAQNSRETQGQWHKRSAMQLKLGSRSLNDQPVSHWIIFRRYHRK